MDKVIFGIPMFPSYMNGAIKRGETGGFVVYNCYGKKMTYREESILGRERAKARNEWLLTMKGKDNE